MFRLFALGFCSKLSILLALVFISPSSEALGQCVKNHLDVKYKDGVGRIRTYECQAGGAKMRVAFHRLDEEVVGSLILRNPRPEILQTVGKFRVLENQVSADLAELFKKFGTKEKKTGGYSMSLSVPQGGTEYSGGEDRFEDEANPDTILTLAPATLSTQHVAMFPFPTRLLGEEIYAKVKAKLAGGPYHGIEDWTPTAQQEKALRTYFEAQCSNKNECNGKKYLDLARFVGDKRFLRISADNGECGAGEEPEGSIDPRDLIVNFAIIKNTSNREISLDDVIGSDSIQPTKIAPGESVGIPLKMVFGGEGVIPYGRKLTIRGLKVNGRRMIFDQMSANFMSVTSGESGASCPYLYALNADGSVKQSYGKIIHAAYNKYRKMTEVVQLSALTTKFMLREEEPERAFIDQVQLRLRMKDKSYLRFAPTTPSLADTDSEYAEIAPFTAIQIAFELPDWIKEEDVERATLAVTGFYRRVHLPPIEVSTAQQPSE